MLAQKGMGKMTEEDPRVPLVPYLDKTPLINTQYKIVDTGCEFDIYELHNWAK